ncbi:hypothetical protein B0T20DRAFT_500964 [Sordaria brevicollis]|uniref:Uncharacterized protein n=1 Tax=Sordaria brevicollis TaxID=83679 RepID=A0AAE0UBD8_SORBR|nr:hypothetical protein B0T20DRAFT_500964 [Sordaria brevicollis]
MEPTAVKLGSITVARKNSPLSLELTSSFLVDSETTSTALGLQQLTAIGLARHSKDGNLWMAKSGSCQLVFKTFINGQLPDPNVIDPAIISFLIGMAAECSEQEEQDRKPAETTYFLCHPDLSSEMIVPPTITCVKFKGLMCKLNLRIDTSWGSKAGRKPKRGSSKKPVEEETVQEPEEPSVAGETQPAGKRRNPRRVTRAADVKYTDIVARKPAARKANTSVNSDSDQVILLSISKEEAEEMALFLDVALRKLVEVKHNSPGIKVFSGDADFPSLIEIAPAVWNLRYLQSMTAHAKTIPTIASGVARLRNAQAASLREKVSKLSGASGAEPPSNNSPSHAAEGNLEEAIMKEVGKRLWTLCQTTIRVEPTVKTGSKRKVKVDEKEAPADTQAEEEEEVTQEEYFSQLTDDGWVDHHHYPPLTHDYLFDSFEEPGTDTDTGTDSDVFEYDYKHQPIEDITLFQEHAEWLSEECYGDEDPFGESELDHASDDGDNMMALDELQPSSEGDYVYADALGRLHPMPRHQALQVQAGQVESLTGNELLLPFDEKEEEDYEDIDDDLEEFLEGYLGWGFV